MADYISRYTGEEIDERLAAVPDKYTMPAGGIPSTDLAEDVQAALDTAANAYVKPAEGIPASDLASGVQTSLGKANTAYQKPSGGIPSTDMTSAVQTSLGKADSAYQKPGTGIPKSDLAEGVQTSLGKADTAIQSLAPVTDLIPAAASTTNQLADKAFVNSSVATNTANYISDNGEPFTSLADLQAYSGPLTNNDYAFVVGTDSAGNTTYTRYKYTASTESWAEEYVLNNSSFTAAQWAAISSGITSADVTKIGNAVLVTAQSLTTEQKTQARSNIGAGTYSKASGGIPASDLASAVQTSLGKADSAYQKPSGGIPSSDMASAVQTSLGKADSAYQKPSGGIPASDLAAGVIPSVPDISTDVAADKTSNSKTSSPKSVYDAIHPAVGSSQPAGGFLPNVMYALGTLTGSVTFALAAATSGIVNHYFWSFTAGSTAPTITWPSGLTWVGGSAPELTAGNHYEISVLDGIAAYLEAEA